MTTVRANLITGGRVPVGSGTITYTPTQPRQATIDNAKIVLPVDTIAAVVAGVAGEKDLEPGPYDVVISVGRFVETYRIVVPTGDPVQLWSLIESSIEYEPVVVSLVKGYRDAAEGFATTATGAATSASGSATTALGYRNTANTAATTATTKATEAEAARAQAFLLKQAAELSEANALAYRNTANTAATTATNKATEADASATIATAKATEAEAARANAYLAQQAAELARDQTVQGAVPDGGVTTIKLVDGAVTKPKLSAGLQASIDKAESAVQLVGGILPQAYLPAVAMVDFLGNVGSQAAMLALVGERGDWCNRTDLGTEWQLIAEPSTSLASWQQKIYPASPVSSVAGRQGAVSLSMADITDATTIGRNVAKGADAAAIRTLIGAGTSSLAIGTTGTTAAAGNDSRLTNTRTPTVGTVPYDRTLNVFGGTRAVGWGDIDDIIRVGRAVTITEVFLSFDSKDASGTTTVDLYKNADASPWFSRGVVAANQAAGESVTGSWTFVKGDKIYAKISSVGATPGSGLMVDLWGLA